jgi:nitroimidazol reductase NimA-like FMN-containing flavoprotein (pyridoxamine 5'-phosphate oxidase superfamily)
VTSRPVRDVLERGTLCYLGAPSPLGPHVTPVVFILERGRLWGTTSRGTTKARRWRSQPFAGGLVRVDRRAVVFRGTVTLYDALRPRTWPVSVVRAPLLALASMRFSRKNARFFAGYARDVARVPLAWSPPARVIFSVGLEDGALLEDGRLLERWGSWAEGAPDRDDGPATPGARSGGEHVGALDEGDLPEDLRGLLGSRGDGALGLAGGRGPVVLPAAWVRNDRGFDAILDRDVLALAEANPRTRAGLVVDRASRWRAAEMSGVLLRGEAEIRTDAAGAERGTSVLANELLPHPVAVRLRPDSAVWWRGWASGSVGRS